MKLGASRRVVATISVALLVTVGCGKEMSLFVERHVITVGTFDGLTIGMSRAATFAAARQLGATTVSAIPCAGFEHVRELPTLSGLEGIRINDEKSYVDIYFLDGHVTKIVSSPVVDFVTRVSIGDKEDAARKELDVLLRSVSDLRASTIVRHDGDDTLHLTALSSDDERKFKSHDCWSFEVTSIKPAGAIYDITFNKAGLTMIIYRRARIRAE